MACCFCCGRHQGRAAAWRSAAGLRGEDEARVNFESGLALCCARGEADSILQRQLIRLNLGQPRQEEVRPLPLLAGARRLHRPAAGLDEAFLEGIGAVGWVSVRPLDLEDAHGSLGLQLQLHARVAPPAASAAWRNEQAAGHDDFWRRASTQVRTRAELRLVLRRCHGEEDLERLLRVDVWLPAPVRGYIESRLPQCGVRMCPNLRLGPLTNDVESTPSGSRVLLGPRTAEQSTARPQTVRLSVKWRGSDLLRVGLSAKLEEEVEASLAEVLRALFGKEVAETSFEEKEDLASLFIEAVRRRTPFVADADARSAKFETLLEEHVLVSLSGALEEPVRSAAARIAGLLAPCTPALSAQAPNLSAAVQAMAPQPPHQQAMAVDERTDLALDGTDLLARLYCRALAPTLLPGTEDASEHAKDVLSPASISASALRRALFATLARLRKDVQADLRRARRPSEEGAELAELKPQMLCGGCRGELPCSACTPPAKPACRYCMAQRPKPCAASCAAPPACAKTCQPGEPGGATKRLLRVHWPLEETSCPLCGSAGRAATECEQCREEQHLDATWLPVAQGAGRQPAQRVEMRPGAAVWWEAPRPGLLRLARHRAWLCRGGAAATLLALALGRLAAADLVHELPLLMLRKLRGPGAGTRADAPREVKGVKRREPPCLLSEDPSLNDATSVGTNLRSSQVGREGWLRRRNTRTKRCRADHYDTNDKTKGQKEAAPASLRFSPSALLDEEDERAAVEAVQAVVAATIGERRGASATATQHCRVLVEHCGLPGRTRRWLRARPWLALPGDDIGALAHAWLSLEEAVLLNRRLRRELDARMAEFRVGEQVGLQGAGRARILGEAFVRLRSGDVVPAEPFSLGRRLPRCGDRRGDLTVQKLESLLVHAEGEQEPRRVAAEELRKLPWRGGSFSPLAFVNAVYEPRQGHVNVRLCGGHRVTLVQCRRMQQQAPAPSGEDGEWQQLWQQLCRGELAFWHAATMGSEEAHGEEDQRLRGDEPPLTFSLPLGELQLHCPRGLALPPPPGHPVRQGPQMRAMPACCTEKPTCLKAAEGPGVTAPCAWSPTVSDGRLGAGGHGARAQGALFSVAYLDHFDGSTYEDAGSTTEQFAQEQGRCFALATPLQVRGQDKRVQNIVPLEELRRRMPQQNADHRYDHLDSSGRARGFVRKGATLAVLQDGEHVRAPFDAWVEDWSESRRGVNVVVLVVQHAWQSGMKVVWQLQKSVLTSVPNGLWAAGTAISFNRSQESNRSRNTPAIGTSSMALKLLHARGARLAPSNEEAGLLAHRRMRGLESLFLREDCSMERVEAARELTWGIPTTDRYPVVYQETGKRAGVANVWLQELGIPLAKAAPHVLVAHIGGRGRRGFEASRGGCLEWTERNTLQDQGFDATKPLLPDIEDATLLKWQEVLSLYGCAVYRSGEEDAEKNVWELAAAERPKRALRRSSRSRSSERPEEQKRARQS